jgi:hypothetical protein
MQNTVRPYQSGDLVDVRQSNYMGTNCPTGNAIVVTASRRHCIKISSLGGDVPAGCDPYYQILKLMSRGMQYCNVHSDNVRLMSPVHSE